MQHSYAVLADHIKAAIRTHEYRVGDRLPSVRELAAAQGVSLHRHALLPAAGTRGLCAGALQVRHVRRGLEGAATGARRAETAPPPAPAGVEYDMLASLQHRMTQFLRADGPAVAAGPAPGQRRARVVSLRNPGRIAQRLLRENPRLLGAYPSGTGLPAFKHEVLRHLAACGIDADPRDLLITNGATEAMQIALRAVARPGDTVIVESPVYFGLLQTIEHLACARWKFPAYPARA